MKILLLVFLSIFLCGCTGSFAFKRCENLPLVKTLDEKKSASGDDSMLLKGGGCAACGR